LLLVLGAVVTTFKVGMADPIWPTYPWHLLLISWDEPSRGYLIEHSHRLAGYSVGCCVIVLAVGLWLARTPGWLKALGGAALAGVIVQGLLGGFRVYLNALVGRDLAAVHGLFAQVVFCMLVSLAVLTSPRLAAPTFGETRRLRGLALLLAALCLAQLVWGVLLRHMESPLAQRLHFVTAFAVVAAAAWLSALVAADAEARRRLGGWLAVLGVLLLVQILLGVESWLGKYGEGIPPEVQILTVGQAVLRTAHVLVGSWILATSVSIVVVLFRGAAVAAHASGVRPQARGVEGVFHSTNGIRAAGRLEGTA
jgi:heme A synthase